MSDTEEVNLMFEEYMVIMACIPEETNIPRGYFSQLELTTEPFQGHRLTDYVTELHLSVSTLIDEIEVLRCHPDIAPYESAEEHFLLGVLDSLESIRSQLSDIAARHFLELH